MHQCRNKNVRILNELPMRGKLIDRKGMVGMSLDIEYYEKTYKYIEILEYIPSESRPKFLIMYNKETKTIPCEQIINGNIGDIVGYKKDRVGEKNIMKCGMEAVIIEYKNATNAKILFENGDIVTCTYSNFKKGSISPTAYKSVHGVGIYNKNLKTADKNGKILKSYTSWSHMLRRCYDPKYHIKEPTYKDCTVCDEWIYYENFKQWYDDNFYTIQDSTMCLDKDILIKGNKIYSPETCVFVNQNINNIFTKNDSIRSNLPIGVTLDNGRYRARVSNGSKKEIFLGMFDNEYDAFYAYKKAKEEIIKQVADEYKDKIPKKLYDAMYNYKVEITD